jgi:hypothetical protein
MELTGKTEIPVSYDTRTTHTRVYVWVRNETLLDQLENRRGRPHTEWRPLVREQLRKVYGYTGRLSWSQNAGCSCGCSPGFVLEGRLVSKDGERLEQVSFDLV